MPNMPTSPATAAMPSSADGDAPARHWPHAIRVEFFVLGTAMGVWGAQVPGVKTHYGLDEGSLALALLAAAAGAVLCLFSAGALVARFGVRRCVRTAGVLMCVTLAAALQSQAYGVLLALMLLLGASSALFDVSINADGNAFETGSGRKVMSGLHAMFSLGGMAGALACAALHRGGVPGVVQMAASALGLVVLAWWSARWLSNRRGDSDESPAPVAWPRGLLLGIGVMTALCMVAEGAMYDWSALFVQQELHTDAATGATGFAAFSAAMALGRLVGDRVRERLAPVALLRVSGVLAACGMAVALTAGTPWAALLGFGFVGLGLSNVVPVLFASAGQAGGIGAAAGVAAVSAVGYMGFMIGPPVVGAIARWTSLSGALWTVAAFAALMALAARPVLGRLR